MDSPLPLPACGAGSSIPSRSHRSPQAAIPVRRARGIDPAVVARELGPRMRGLARHHGAGPDAEDVWQRALEIAVRRADELDPDWVEPWLRVVVRNEARRIARSRRHVLLEEDLERASDAHEARDAERIEFIDLRERARRDLPRLKPQERRALGLLGAGLSYREICARTGWTYTKVNRCVGEGRAALRRMGSAAA